MSLQNVNSYTYSPGFTQGQYHNAILCISGNVQSLYLNGVLVGSTTSASNILSYYPTINQILLGCAGDKSNGFTGYLDDFRMYNYAFNSSQVSTLYSNRNVIAYYPFDSSLNATTPNHSTMVYDASLVGNAVIITSTTNYKVGTGALSLTNTAGIASTSYMNSTCGFSNTTNNNLSISLWFKTSAVDGRIMRLIDLSPAVGTPGIFIDISGTNGINTLYNKIPITIPTYLVLHWPFDTNMNESVNGYTGTLYGTTPAITTTKYRVGTSSLDCTGTLAYVKYTNSSGTILPISNTYTFSFWYYPTSGAKYYSHLFAFSNAGGNDEIGIYFNLNALDLYVIMKNGSSSIYSSAGSQITNVFLTVNTWNHIALSITSTSSNISFTLWRNNSKTTYNRASSQGIPQVARQLAFMNGAGTTPLPPSTSGDSPTTAYVDDFRVYTTLLTDAEVTTLYNTPIPVPNYLVLHWPFDTNMNESVNGYTATLYGTTSPAITNSVYKVGTGSLNCSSATGTIAYVKYTNASGTILPISNTYTFSFWYYPTRTAINYSHLFNFCNSSGSDDIDLLFNLGTLDLYLGIRSGTSSIYSSAGLQVLSGLSLTTNIWNHVALSMTSTSSNVSFTLWVNNVKLTYTRASSQGIPQVARQVTYINGAASNDSTTAYVDDFRVYTTLLTDAEVTTLYNTR